MCSGRTPRLQQETVPASVTFSASLPVRLSCFLATKSAQMATKYSDLELAINSLVTEFHKAGDNKPTMNTTQFQSMISNQLPTFVKRVDNEEGLAQVLQQIGVKSGDNISFENFWALINKEAIQLFGSTHKEKNVKCGCMLQ